tara:strand:- start:62 stop:262 length:201 start_codon:yes stop_codon:yes gene_type:complete
MAYRHYGYIHYQTNTQFFWLAQHRLPNLAEEAGNAGAAQGKGNFDVLHWRRAMRDGVKVAEEGNEN